MKLASRGLPALAGGVAIAAIAAFAPASALATPARSADPDRRTQLQPAGRQGPLHLLRPQANGHHRASSPRAERNPQRLRTSRPASRPTSCRPRRPPRPSPSSTPTTTRTRSPTSRPTDRSTACSACTTANGCFRKLNQNGADQPAAARRHRLGRRDLARPRHGLGGLPELPHHCWSRPTTRPTTCSPRSRTATAPRREVRLDELGRRRGRHRDQLRLDQYFKPPASSTRHRPATAASPPA